MAESNLTAARLRELLNYDPSTGLFTWRVSRQGSGNSSGLLGVSRSKVNDANPWLAQIKPPGCGTKNLGYFSTPEEAHEAYLAAKRLLHDGNTL